MTNKELIERMRDMADCADASYALLNEVYKIDEWNKIFGDTNDSVLCDMVVFMQYCVFAFCTYKYAIICQRV